MTDYSKLSDFEINEAVSMALVSQSKNPEAKYVAIGHYCNSWADAGPIIQEHGICIGYDGISWDASCPFRDINPVSDWKEHPYRPLRMAMIVFLMMNEGE